MTVKVRLVFFRPQALKRRPELDLCAPVHYQALASRAR